MSEPELQNSEGAISKDGCSSSGGQEIINNTQIELVTNTVTTLSSTRSLFVGDLSFFCKEHDLNMLFSTVGYVIGVDIKRGRSGDSLMHGFVEMESEEIAEAALFRFNDFKFMGRKMR